MKKSTKIILAVAVLAAALVVTLFLLLAGNNTLDVVSTKSITSFGAVAAAMPDNVQADGSGPYWVLTAPDGEASFLWRRSAGQSAAYEAMLAWDAQPFINAGLDTAKLPEAYTAADGQLSLGVPLADKAIPDTAEATPQAGFEALVRAYPTLLNYHASLDHFGIKLGDGNLFEWAGDLAVNTATGKAQDKDIVFVLNPEPLIAAGVDPAKVEGWVYAQVEVMQNNANVLVYKFLKPFTLS